MNERKTNRFKKFLYSQKVAPFVFILPFLITFCVFFFYPVVSAIIMSVLYHSYVVADDSDTIGTGLYAEFKADEAPHDFP